jgi:hypothetical protein
MVEGKLVEQEEEKMKDGLGPISQLSFCPHIFYYLIRHKFMIGVRNPILVTIPIQPMNSSIGRTYYTCNDKTQYTVNGDEKEKGKTHVS